MKSQDLYIFTASDVRRTSKPDVNRANIIDKVAVPAIKFKNVSQTGGGAPMDVNWVIPQIEAPEPKFGVKGIDKDVFDGLGQSDVWTFAGAFKKQNGVMVPARAIIEGIIAEWEPDEQASGDLMGCNHVFQEVTHYEFHLENKELWYVDWEERVMRAAGQDHFNAVNQALGIG